MAKVMPGFYVSDQLRDLERRAVQAGVTEYAMMQRAAAAAFREISRRWPKARGMAVVCGPGNNGGDGYEIARLALAGGWNVTAWELPSSRRKPHGPAAIARKAWTADGGKCSPLRPASLKRMPVVVDALFGIGLARVPEGAAADAIIAINAARKRGAGVVAVDVPSGLDADRGTVRGAAVEADLTVTFIGDKPGLHTGRGPDHAGDVVVDDLALPARVRQGIEPAWQALDAGTLAAALPRRRRTAHKGDHGHVLLVGGDTGMGGAILLAARGALRAGAGKVSVATHPFHAAALTAAQPELMVHAAADAAILPGLLELADVVAVGPGLGRGDWGRRMWSQALRSRLPVVVDADGLNWLAENPEPGGNRVLTPHPGEAARLLGSTTAQVQSDRVAAAAAVRERYGGVVVLKGAGTLVVGEAHSLCARGGPGLAVGGTGDVLCGIIAGFIGQGLAPEHAAQAAVAAHALAGERAAAGGERGMLPSDLLAALRAVLR